MAKFLVIKDCDGATHHIKASAITDVIETSPTTSQIHLTSGCFANYAIPAEVILDTLLGLFDNFDSTDIPEDLYATDD